MAEVLVSGPPDRPPRLWPRVVAVAVVVAAAGWLLAPRIMSRADLTGPAPTTAATRRSTPPTTTPAWAGPAPGSEQVQPRLDGVAAALPADVVLAIGGSHPIGLGATTGPAAVLSRVPLGAQDAVTAVIPVPAGLMIQVQRSGPDPWVPADVYLIRTDGSIGLLAHADQVVVGHRSDSFYTLRQGPNGIGPGTLTQLSWSGGVLWQRSVPEGLSLRADTANGLLVTLTPPRQGPDDLRIVDPRTLAVVRHLGPVGYVVTATGTRAAWTSYSCVARCRLTVADLAGGAQQTIPLPEDFQPGAVAFSPDPRRIAVGYWGRHPEQPGGAAPGFVEVTDLVSGRVTVVPGVATGVKQAADLAWTADGRALAVSVGWTDTDTRRAGLWPLDGGPVHVLPWIIPGAGAASLAVLPAAVGQ